MLTISLILALLSCIFVIFPLVRKPSGEAQFPAHVKKRELDELLWQSNSIQSTIRDLDLDFQTGKLSEFDFSELSKEQEKRLERINHKIKSLTGDDNTTILKELEDEIRQQKSTILAKNLTCKNCGKAIRQGDKFCPNCGTQLKED